MKVECWPCGGCGIDEGGEAPVLCLACEGTGSLSWSRVVWLGMADRYAEALPSDGLTPADRIRQALRDRIIEPVRGVS